MRLKTIIMAHPRDGFSTRRLLRVRSLNKIEK